MSLETTLLLLKFIETVIMIIAVGVAYYRANEKHRNNHFTNGRGRAAILIAFCWAYLTFLVIKLDYEFLYGLNNQGEINIERLEMYIDIEIFNIFITILTAAHLLGCEFKWLKKD